MKTPPSPHHTHKEIADNGTVIFYEMSPTANGKEQRVLIDGEWVYCPSGDLMDKQVEHKGFKRGCRIRSSVFGSSTVLSVYSFVANDGATYYYMCHWPDMFKNDPQRVNWRQSCPITGLADEVIELL